MVEFGSYNEGSDKLSKGHEVKRKVTLTSVTDKYKLSPAGEALLAVIAQPESRLMTVTDICQQANISRDSYYRLFKQKEFQAAYYEACRVVSVQAAMPAMQSLAMQAATGDVAAAKMILELNALYAPSANLNITTGQDDTPTLKDILSTKK